MPDKKIEIEEKEGEQKNQTVSQQEQQQQQQQQYYFYNEKDFKERTGHAKYELQKKLEEYCFHCNNIRQNLKTYVICAGNIYGHGEKLFYELFRQAYSGIPQQLNYFNEGTNIIPTIHVQDLANIISWTIEKEPKQNYILAIDYGQNTQKMIIESISETLGTGQIKKTSFFDSGFYQNYDLLTSNIRVQPTSIFDEKYQQFQIIEYPYYEDEERYDDIRPIKVQFSFAPKDFEIKSETSIFEKNSDQSFEWKYKNGFVANIKEISQEFLKYRGLRPNKIFLCGPPASGKTYYGKTLAQIYNVPYICIKDIVEKAKIQVLLLKLQQFVFKKNDKLGDEVRQRLAEIKQQLVNEALVIFEAEQKKLKRRKGYKPKQFDDSHIIPRIPDDLLYKLYKQRLSNNDCKFKGYILDGYPKTLEQVKGIFIDDCVIQKVLQIPIEINEEELNNDEPIKEQVDQEQEQQQEEKNSQQEEQQKEEQQQFREEIIEETVKRTNKTILPYKVLYFESSDDFLKERLKQLDPELIKSTHFNEEGMNRRLPLYRKIVPIDDINLHPTQFFKEEQVLIKKLQLDEILADLEKQQLKEEKQRKKLEEEEKLKEQPQPQELDNEEQEETLIEEQQNFNTELQNSIIEFIELEGKFKTYNEYRDEKDKELEEKLQKELLEREEEKIKKIQLEVEKKQQEEKYLKEQQEADAQIEAIWLKEISILHQKSEPLRQYLQDLLLPYLTQGLLTLTKELPEDPIEQLAEFLMSKRKEVFEKMAIKF